MKYFVCPHCNQKGISFYAKLRSWRHNRVACKKCGKLSYKSSFLDFLIHPIGHVAFLVLLYFWFVKGEGGYLVVAFSLIPIVAIIKTFTYEMKK